MPLLAATCCTTSSMRFHHSSGAESWCVSDGALLACPFFIRSLHTSIREHQHSHRKLVHVAITRGEACRLQVSTGPCLGWSSHSPASKPRTYDLAVCVCARCCFSLHLFLAFIRSFCFLIKTLYNIDINTNAKNKDITITNQNTNT